MPACCYPPFALRPDASGPGRGLSGSTGANSSETWTSSTVANASSVATVTFSEPRSTRPTYDRSIPDSNARRSCDRPFATRKRLTFQPMVVRTSMGMRNTTEAA